jgi:small ubiquitin-related modifier
MAEGEGVKSEQINLKVKDQVAAPSSPAPLLTDKDGAVVFFKIKRGTALRKLMEAYCSRQSKQMDQVAFLFDGKRINPASTASDVRSPLAHTPHAPQLGLEDDDEIDAVVHMVGGCV